MHSVETKKKLLLWFAVATVVVFILALWVLNMKTLIYDVGRNRSQEGEILRSVEEDVSHIFASFSIQDSIGAFPTTTASSSNDAAQQQQVERDIRASLSAIAASATASSSTTTTE